MEWQVDFHIDFRAEFETLSEPVQDEILALMELLRMAGPHLKRPDTDTLSGSRHSNMKELRFDADNGVWRVAYAFDPQRMAILLVGGDKSGISQKRYYRTLITKADARFDAHLANLNPKGMRK